MYESPYSEKLRDPRWQRKRLEIFQRDDFTCLACGSTTKTLHVHHLAYKGDPWDCPSELLETLCETCHEIREDFDEFWKHHSTNRTLPTSSIRFVLWLLYHNPPSLMDHLSPLHRLIVEDVESIRRVRKQSAALKKNSFPVESNTTTLSGPGLTPLPVISGTRDPVAESPPAIPQHPGRGTIAA